MSLSKLVSSDSSIEIIVEPLSPSCAFTSSPKMTQQPIEGLLEKLAKM
jgi:hypothetical protein